MQNSPKNRIILAGFAVVVLLILSTVVRVPKWPLKWADWTGFESGFTVNTELDSNNKVIKTIRIEQPGKTLWDLLNLMSLLGVPILLLFLSLRFQSLQRELEKKEKDAEDARENARQEQLLEIAKANRNQDLQIADEKQKDEVLRRYIDSMKELLLKEKLGESNEDDGKVRDVARILTLTALSQLNQSGQIVDRDFLFQCRGNPRKGSLIQFLMESGLIKKSLNGSDKNPVIALVRANLNGANLSELRLESCDLSFVKLRGANLNGVKFNGAVLVEADLRNVECKHAEFKDADLSRTRFENTNLCNVDFSGANFCGADLHGANLSSANLSSANLSGANFCDADLRGANLSRANLSGTNLNGANLSRANLSRSDLRNVNLSGAQLSDADLSEAKLCGSNLRNANFFSVLLNNSGDYGDYFYCGQANLRLADLSDADLSGANLSNANFEQAKLIRANLEGSKLSEMASYRDLNRPTIDLDDPFDEFGYVGLDYELVEQWCPAKFQGTDFSEASLRELDFTDIDLSEANLIGANLSGANLTNAKCPEEQISVALLCKTKLPTKCNLDPDRDCKVMAIGTNPSA